VKKRVLYFIVVLALVLCMTLPTTTPVMAGQISGSKHTIPALPNIYYIGDTIYYETTVTNPVGNTANNTLTRIWDTLPDGTVVEFLDPGETLVQVPGHTDTFYTQYVVDWDDAVYNEVLGYWIVTDTFRAEGYDSNGDGLYVLVTKNSHILDPHIDLEKYVWDGAGWQDANAATGPYLPSTQNPVIFKFEIDNDGIGDLTSVNLTDTDMTVFYTDQGCTTAAVFPVSTLADDDPTVTVYGKLAFAPGQHSNNATVTGTPPVGDPVSDSDPAHYFGSAASIDLEKAVWDGATWQDANTPAGPYLTSAQNPVIFRFVITNNDNVNLINVTLTDTDMFPFYNDQACTSLASFPTTLTMGQAKTYYGKLAWAPGQHSNNATASGTPPVGAPVSDSDPANYFGGNYAIDLIKYVSVNNQTSWDDANLAPGPSILVGKDVYFKFYIRNTGNVALTGITLTDTMYNLAGITPALPASLAAAAEYNGIIGPIAATAGNHTNTGNATGYWEGNPVSDTDPANYFGGNYAIDLIKYASVNNQTSWDDANLAPGPSILVGKGVYFKFYIKNTGNVTLTGITLTDTMYNLAGITPALPASLAAGAEYNGIIGPIAATAGGHTNTGNATGYWEGNPVSDTDPANYFGGNYAIDLIKYVSVNNQTSWDDANLAPGPAILVGKDVYFKFYIRNTGNVTLTGITLTDTMYNLAGITPALPASLAAGAEYNGIIGPIAAAAGGHTNTGNATGYWEGNPVSDTDPANYIGSPPIPAIDIEKHTNGVDADSPPGPDISVNSTVTWAYIVTNTGDVDLTGIVVTDDKLGVIGTVASLPVGANATLSVSGIAIAGQYANNATVIGYYGTVNVTDWDPSHYYNRPTTVGWETYPINKVRVLLPWIGLVAAIIAGASLLVLRRRRLIQKN